jgi:hypothetical protein
MTKFYTSDVEQLMQLHYSRLTEKEQRHYAAIESKKLGYGGKSYLRRLFGLSLNRLYRGIDELDNEGKYAEIPLGKQRRIGGGRKKILHNPNPSRATDNFH